MGCSHVTSYVPTQILSKCGGWYLLSLGMPIPFSVGSSRTCALMAFVTLSSYSFSAFSLATKPCLLKALSYTSFLLPNHPPLSWPGCFSLHSSYTPTNLPKTSQKWLGVRRRTRWGYSSSSSSVCAGPYRAYLLSTSTMISTSTPLSS